MQHASKLFYTLPDTLLAERLCRLTGDSKVFSGNSGAEANEGALTAADFPVLAAIVEEKYWRLLKEPGIFSIQCKVLLPEEEKAV